MANSDLINILAKVYRDCSLAIENYELRSCHYDKEVILRYRQTKSRIERTAHYLSEKNRLIIENEVLCGKEGKWYLEFYSENAYRRLSKEAYEEFLRLIEL